MLFVVNSPDFLVGLRPGVPGLRIKLVIGPSDLLLFFIMLIVSTIFSISHIKLLFHLNIQVQTCCYLARIKII